MPRSVRNMVSAGPKMRNRSCDSRDGTPRCASSHSSELPRPGGVSTGRGSDMALEVSGEVGLIVEANADGNVGGRLAIEEPLTGDLDAPAETVGGWGGGERRCKGSDR